MKVLVNSDGDVLTSGGKAIKSSGGGGGGNYNIVQTVNGNNCSIAITDQDVFVLQDKTVTTNGQHTADAQYSGLGTVTVNVPPTPTQSKNMVLGAAAPATVNPDSGYDLSSVVPQIDSSVIKAENIAQGVQMLGITGTHQGGGGGTIPQTAVGTFTMPPHRETLEINVGFRPHSVTVYLFYILGCYSTVMESTNGSGVRGYYYQNGYNRSYNLTSNPTTIDLGHVINLTANGFLSYTCNDYFAGLTAYYVAIGEPAAN